MLQSFFLDAHESRGPLRASNNSELEPMQPDPQVGLRLAVFLDVDLM